jgi:hypothetical protein
MRVVNEWDNDEDELVTNMARGRKEVKIYKSTDKLWIEYGLSVAKSVLYKAP